MRQSFEVADITFHSGNDGHSCFIKNPSFHYSLGNSGEVRNESTYLAMLRYIIKEGNIVYSEVTYSVGLYEVRAVFHYVAEFEILQNNRIVTDAFYQNHPNYRSNKVICDTPDEIIEMLLEFHSWTV